MTPTETAAILRQFNEWRRDFDDKIEQPDSRDIGMALDAAVEMIDRLEAAESEAIEQARLNGMGSEREAALMAKLEAAEKERDALRAELAQLHKEADKFGDGIDWIQRALQAEAQIEQMEQQEPVAWADAFGEPFRKKSEIDGVASPLYALPGAQTQGEEK